MVINKQYIIAAVLIIPIVIVGILVFLPDSDASKGISEWFPGVEVRYKAEIDYTVEAWGSIELGISVGTMGIKIDQVLVKESTFIASIGPFAITPQEYEGKVVLTSEFQGEEIDRLEKDIEIWSGWAQSIGWKKFTDCIWLGKKGTGTITIRAKVYYQGEKVSEDTTTRTI